MQTPKLGPKISPSVSPKQLLTSFNDKQMQQEFSNRCDIFPTIFKKISMLMNSCTYFCDLVHTFLCSLDPCLKIYEGSYQILIRDILFSKYCRRKIWLHLFRKTSCKGKDMCSCNSNLVQLICVVASISHIAINETGGPLFSLPRYHTLLCSFSHRMVFAS